METPVLIALIIAGVIVFGILMWLLITVMIFRAARKAQKEIFAHADEAFPRRFYGPRGGIK